MAARRVSLSFKGGERMKGLLARMAKRADNARTVSVGFFENARYPSAYTNRVAFRWSTERAPIHVAQAAFYNEFGTATAPARPFFRTMIAECSPKWGESMAYLMRTHDYDAKAVLTQMGIGIKGQLQLSIRDWTDPPNSAVTIAIKGFNKPLVDEGIMLRNVGYEVASR